MKVMYLTWGETPRSYGVFGSQVIGQFVETRKVVPGAEFHFVSAVPLVHSGLVREKMGYLKEMKEIRARLSGISFSVIPIYAPQTFMNSSRHTFRFMHLGAQAHLTRKIRKIDPEIVHCRSYHAAYAALKVREKYRFSYKVVFDARGLWPEEIALKKNNSEEHPDYQFWKNIEKWILSKTDVAVAVSDNMAAHHKSIGCQRSECIYLSASVEALKPKNGVDNSGPDDTFRLCYVGALGSDTWHRPEPLLGLYQHVQTICGNAKLVIVTTSNHQLIREQFQDVPASRLEIVSTRTVAELSDILSRVDFGLLSYFIPSSHRDRQLSSMVLAVKTAEYLAAGLPMLVNRYCGGAASIVQAHNAGIAYDPISFKELTLERLVALKQPAVRARNSELAESLFDYASNGQRYAKLYASLV